MNYIDKINFAKTLIKNTIDQHNKEKLFLASSFGKDSIVLMHLAMTIFPQITTITLVSDTEFQETYEYIEKMIEKWKINCIKIHFEQRELIKTNPNLCCRNKKVEMMRSIAIDKTCWLSGIRRSEGSSRQGILPVETFQGLEKVNPLIYFSELDIWRYIAVNQLDVHPLYSQGYRSLGCRHCSKKETHYSENERDGRWGGLDSQGGECGIHTEKLK